MQRFANDLHTGVTRRVGYAHDGSPLDNMCFDLVMSVDNRRVFFTSWATNVIPGDTNGWAGLYIRDLRTGAAERVDVTVDWTSRRAAFYTLTNNLVPGDTNDSFGIFVRHLT